MAAIVVQQQRKTRWATIARRKISSFSKGLSEILAGAGEPLMRYAAIYLALATGVSVIKWMPLYNFAQGLVIATPEFVLLGALSVAEIACESDRDRKWGRLLYWICALLALIMIATFVDIFIYQFPDVAIKGLNFARCLVAVGFSVVLGKLEDDEQEQGAVAPDGHLEEIARLQQALDHATQKASEAQAAMQEAHRAEIANLHQALQVTTQSTNELASRSRQDAQEWGEKITTLEQLVLTLQASKITSETPEDVNRSVNEDGNNPVNEIDDESSSIVDIQAYRDGNKTSTRKAKSVDSKSATPTGNGTARQKALRIIKRTPEIAPADLAKRAGITRQYASKLLADLRNKVVNE
jgi:hypothetical protein